MKVTKIILILCTAAVFFNTACDELLSDLLKFNSQWYPHEFSVDATDTIGHITFITDVIEADVDSALEANGVSRANLSALRMSDARITVLTEGYTFDPVDSVRFYMDSPGMGKTMVAWLDSVPEGATTIDLDLNLDDLTGYLDESNFIFTATGHLNSRVTEKVDFLAEFRYVLQGGLGQ